MDKNQLERRDKQAFIRFMIDSGVLSFGDFVTKSGRQTPYFVNTGNYRTGSQIARLGKFYASTIVQNMKAGNIPGELTALYGPAYKGIPLAVAAAAAMSEDYGHDLNYCFNRKEAKDHGEGGSLIGYRPKDGDSLLIIEDVITAGTAVRETVPLLQATGDIQIAGLVVSVDRMEKGQGELSAIQEIERDFGIRTFAIVTIREIFDLLFSESEVGDGANQQLKQRLADYMAKYCVG